MKKIFRNTLVICLGIMLLPALVFGAGEKSLVRDTGDLSMSYGGGFKITAENDKEIVDIIRKTGKTDFKEGIYTWFALGEDWGPSSSEQYIEVGSVEGYNKLIFDVTKITEDKFGDLEAHMSWIKDEEWIRSLGYDNYEDYEKDFDYPKENNDKFSINKVVNNNWFDMAGVAKILIVDKDWNYKYAVVVSEQWETVEIDISDFDSLTVYFSIDDSAGVLVANPRLVSDGRNKGVKQNSKIKAIPSNSVVNINGKAVDFDAYTIAGNNYFKIRDLAKVLNGTEKQFEVGWDNVNKSINLVSGQSYTVVGGELSKSDSKGKQAIESTSTIYKDGEEVQLKAYTIGNNNYFKLRDIGRAFNFDVDWDNATKTIKVNTSVEYTE